MTQVAKIFSNGRSQTVRLPAAYHFDSKEVYIRRDPLTGAVILSRKPESWEEYFKLASTLQIPAGYMNNRPDNIPPED